MTSIDLFEPADTDEIEDGLNVSQDAFKSPDPSVSTVMLKILSLPDAVMLNAPIFFEVFCGTTPVIWSSIIVNSGSVVVLVLIATEMYFVFCPNVPSGLDHLDNRVIVYPPAVVPAGILTVVKFVMLVCFEIFP